MEVSSNSLQDKKVLVVDDDNTAATMIQKIVARQGVECEVAFNGTEGLSKIDSFQPHLVILDQQMDDLNGLEVLRELRSQNNYVAVVFASGNSDHELIVDCLRQGADDFITKPFNAEELAARIYVRLRLVDLHKELAEANQALLQLAKHDSLTGLYNMRWAYDKVQQEINRAARGGHSVSVVMMDIDHFKKVNDGHDHLFGSYVLKDLARVIQGNTRKTDFAARYGGDEFLIVLPETDIAGSEKFLERFRKLVQGRDFNDGRHSIRLTTSIGFATVSGETDLDAKTFIEHADKALYQAKADGRNRVVGYHTLKSDSAA